MPPPPAAVAAAAAPAVVVVAAAANLAVLRIAASSIYRVAVLLLLPVVVVLLQSYLPHPLFKRTEHPVLCFCKELGAWGTSECRRPVQLYIRLLLLLTLVRSSFPH